MCYDNIVEVVSSLFSVSEKRLSAEDVKKRFDRSNVDILDFLQFFLGNDSDSNQLKETTSKVLQALEIPSDNLINPNQKKITDTIIDNKLYLPASGRYQQEADLFLKNKTARLDLPIIRSLVMLCLFRNTEIKAKKLLENTPLTDLDFYSLLFGETKEVKALSLCKLTNIAEKLGVFTEEILYPNSARYRISITKCLCRRDLLEHLPVSRYFHLSDNTEFGINQKNIHYGFDPQKTLNILSVKENTLADTMQNIIDELATSYNIPCCSISLKLENEIHCCAFSGYDKGYKEKVYQIDEGRTGCVIRENIALVQSTKDTYFSFTRRKDGRLDSLRRDTDYLRRWYGVIGACKLYMNEDDSLLFTGVPISYNNKQVGILKLNFKASTNITNKLVLQLYDITDYLGEIIDYWK